MEEEFFILGQTVTAMILGAIVGWERQVAGKGAGMRTHMLVCAGAMLFVRLGTLLIAESAGRFNGGVMRADPVGIIGAIVTGVAFIGAGTVIRNPEKHVSHGLTTAASLLLVATVGIAVALHRYVLAVGLTVLVFLVLHFVPLLEPRALTESSRTPVSSDKDR